MPWVGVFERVLETVGVGVLVAVRELVTDAVRDSERRAELVGVADGTLVRVPVALTSAVRVAVAEGNGVAVRDALAVQPEH